MKTERYRSDSIVNLDEWVGPEIVDSTGFLRPGKILEWMDVVGVIVSSRYAGAPVLTASIDGMRLKKLIKVGSRVTMSAKVAYCSKRSIGVSVKMDHIPENVATMQKNTVTGYMVFVALDRHGKSIEVPKFIPGCANAKRLFDEGEVRHQFRKKPLKEVGSGERIFEEYGKKKGFFEIQEFLKQLPSRIRNPWEIRDSGGMRSRHYSYIHKIEPVFSGQLNFTGSLYGGRLVNWVETSAHLSARAYLDGADVVMLGLHGLNFLRPVKKNVFLHIRSHVAHTNKTSITILTEVQSENPLDGEVCQTLRSFMTYKPLRRIGIPQLELKTEDEQNLSHEVEMRLKLQNLVVGESEADFEG